MTAETLALSIVEDLRRAGHEAYWVGGCVRDRLLGRQVQDFDVATDATPQDVTMLFPRSELVGAAFGVVIVKARGEAVEVATYRVDHEYKDGRRPESVTFTRAPRRTSGAATSPSTACSTTPSSGASSTTSAAGPIWKPKLIRAIGDPEKALRRGPLRMLRAVRFAARLGFEIEPATRDAIRAQAAASSRSPLSAFAYELNRILTEGGARRGFELLDECGLLAEILPEVKDLQGVQQPRSSTPRAMSGPTRC
jgi:tRNA nucleotidyltransferase/poly(A) polymerase